jgi:CRISPR-associated protein Cas2
MTQYSHVVVSYDIASDRRRRRASKSCAARLTRVQASVFEGRIREFDLIELEQALERIIEPEADSVRIFRLCARCREATLVRGWGPILFGDPEDIVL